MYIGQFGLTGGSVVFCYVDVQYLGLVGILL
jgi:hypothetical protein